MTAVENGWIDGYSMCHTEEHMTSQQSVNKELKILVQNPIRQSEPSVHLGIWTVSTVDMHHCLLCTRHVLLC